LYGRPVLRRLLIQPTDPGQLACEGVAFFQRRITALIFPFRVWRRRESAYPSLFYDSPAAKIASSNSPGLFAAGNAARLLSNYLTNVCYSLQLNVYCSLQRSVPQVDAVSEKLAWLLLSLSHMKSSFKLVLILAAATAFFVVQPVKAGHVFQGGPTFVNVPDGGSTISLLGFALLGVAALRRKLGR